MSTLMSVFTTDHLKVLTTTNAKVYKNNSTYAGFLYSLGNFQAI